MAELVKTVIAASDMSKALTFTAAGASDYIVDDNKDMRLMLVIKNASASTDETLTLKAGNGHRGAAGDLVITVVKSTSTVVPIERVDSSRVKNISGTNVGKILTVATGADLTVAVVSVL